MGSQRRHAPAGAETTAGGEQTVTETATPVAFAQTPNTPAQNEPEAPETIHEPTVRVKEAAGSGRGELYADALSALFGLDPE